MEHDNEMSSIEARKSNVEELRMEINVKLLSMKIECQVSVHEK